MIRYKCLLCGRDKFTHKSPHYCIGGFRKHHIKWEIINNHIEIKKINNMAEINEIVSQETINTLKETSKLLSEVTEKMNNLFMSCMKPEKPERLLKFEDIAETEKYKVFEIKWNGFGDKKLFKKIKAFGQLLIIADYYNEGWQPDWSNKSENKYSPYYDNDYDAIGIDYYSSINENGIIFKSQELLETAIKNNRKIFEAYLK